MNLKLLNQSVHKNSKILCERETRGWTCGRGSAECCMSCQHVEMFCDRRFLRSKQAPEIHAKVLRSSATASNVRSSACNLALSLACSVLFEMLPAGRALPMGTAVVRGTNRAHNGSEDCQDCNDLIDSAGSKCKPHHCVRCRTYALATLCIV